MNPNGQRKTESQYKKWIEVLSGNTDTDTIVVEYLTDQIQFEYLKQNNDLFTEDIVQNAVSIVIKALLEVTPQDIRELLKRCDCLREISTGDFPLFGNFAAAVLFVPKELVEAKTCLSYKELGYRIFPMAVSDGAAIKYGETHGKTAALLDLAVKSKEKNHTVFYPSAIAPYYCAMEEDKKIDFLVRLCYRIPIIQYAAIDDDPKCVVDKWMQSLFSQKSISRRKPNVLEVLSLAIDE